MKKYLLELIKEHNRVIIPNFGAFIVSQGKEMSIIFNGFLSFNDGLLIGYISNEEGIDTVAAAQKVDDFVGKVNQSLETIGVFEIENLGKFIKEDNGSARFIQSGTESSYAHEGDEREDDASLESIELLDINPVDDKDAIIVNEPVTIRSATEPDHLLTIESLQPQIPVTDISAEYTVKNIIEPAMEDVKEELDNNSSYSDDDNNDRKNKFSIRLIIIILVVLILLALGYFLFFGNNPFNVFKDKMPPPVEQPIEEAPQVIEEPEPVFEEPDLEDVVEETPVLTDTQHHIILGSFKDQWRADQLVEKLKGQGYAQANVFERNSRFLVSVESFFSVGKALERQEVLLDELKMESWVLTVR
ncbi:MAG: hypothetical protein LBV41_02900 [Cytophagaceae bacterium]|jgi:nucleoid DNA-binding protein|nr:hypothetical protein [Cytophagaceae bacterium]